MASNTDLFWLIGSVVMFAIAILAIVIWRNWSDDTI